MGDFNLASRAYNERQTEHTVQVTETAMVSPRAINETRFQYLRSNLRDASQRRRASPSTCRARSTGGGATVGQLRHHHQQLGARPTRPSTRRGSTRSSGAGACARRGWPIPRCNNFAGTFTFYTLAQYQQTLALQQAGYTGEQIAQLGAGPRSSAATPARPRPAWARPMPALFVNDDWRVRPNLTLSYGVRYEAQNNLGGLANWAPRVGIAWGLDAKANRPAKTVLRAGVGTLLRPHPALRHAQQPALRRHRRSNRI